MTNKSDNFEILERWFNFLDGLHSMLSKYEVQTNKSKYNVYDVKDWGKDGNQQGINISHANFQSFLNILGQYNIAEQDYFQDKTVTDLQLKELNHILDSTLKSSEDFECLKSCKLIKGNFISVKNILSHIQNSDNCKPFASEGVKNTIIFALHAIFIDEDIILHGSSITIIAPRWEIIGNRKIDLSGFEGDYYKSNRSIEVIHSLKPGKNGKNGKPGLSGGPGGNFFGIGKKFINGNNLTIITKGGAGGTGENGENGIEGENGNSMIIPDDVKYSGDICKENKFNGFLCKELTCKTGLISSLYFTPKMSCAYEIFGEAGHPGGNGGDGGKGGIGGNAGKIILFELNERSEISKYSLSGEDGKNGTAGLGAVGGKYGKNYFLSCYVSLFSNKCTSVQYDNFERATPGYNGTDGGNSEFIEKPKKPVSTHRLYEIINDYKNYARKNLINHVQTSNLIKFLRLLDDDNKTNGIYNTVGLFGELQNLEKQFHEVNAGIIFLPFYKSLLNRIKKYAKDPKKNEKTVQHKKALNYLYTSTLGRIYDLEENLESMLITNVENYLMTVKEDVEELKDFQKAQNKNDIISKYRKEYKMNIDKKIEEAQNLIQNQISPEINSINHQIDEDIETLVNEVVLLEQNELAEKQQLIHSKAELQKTLKIKALFNVIDFTSHAVGYLGPAGAFAGSVTGEVSSWAESMIFKKENYETKLLQLPESVLSHIHEGKSLISSMMSEKVNRLDQFLDNLSHEVNKNPEAFGNLSSKLSNIKEKLSAVNTDDFNFLKITSLENELNQELKVTKEKVNVNKNVEEKKTLNEKINKFTDRFQKVYQFGLGMHELTEKFHDDKSQIEVISEAIEKSQDDFRSLKDYEETVYNTISPVLNNIKNDMDETRKNLGTKSVVALDVTKWKVQNTLKNIKTQIQKMTQGYEVSENLSECIQKLDESMNILISVYDHIQDYHKQQNLANYIADVSSESAISISITDPKLEKVINHLEVLIRSNLILERYKVSVEAFKQFAFPFTHLYLEQITLPSSIKLNNSLNNLAYEVTKQMDIVIYNLKKYKNFVTKYQNRIGLGHFNSRGMSTQPFFVWKNEKHKNMISKLLSGEEVLVLADITKTEVNEDAVKFKVIALDFTSNNATKQPEINDILKAFRINLTHLGNSYYRYNKKIYVIPTNKYSIWYHYERDNNGKPTRKNREYDDIENGDSMLSPYALWKLSLTNLPNKYNISFANLELYKDELNIELGGYASFVVEDLTDQSDLMLEKHYKTVEKYKESLDDKLGLADSEFLLQKIDEVYQGLNTESKLRKNVFSEDDKLSSDSWFSWKLPNFNILPGAEATLKTNFNFFSKFAKNINLEPDNIQDPAVKDSTLKMFTEYITSGVITTVDFVSSQIFKLKPIFDSNLSHDITKTKNSMSVNCHLENSNLNHAFSKIKFMNISDSRQQVSVNYNFNNNNNNLMLAQLILGKLFGTNESLKHCCYISPNREKDIKLEELSRQISSDLEINSHQNGIGDFLNNYHDAPQWYQSMHADMVNEIMMKRKFRDDKRAHNNYSCEKIFKDSAVIIL